MVNPALTLSGLVSIALPIVIILIVLFILFKLGKFVLKYVLGVIVNSVLGFIAIFILNALFNIGIPFTWPIIIATALFGLPAVGTMVILHVLAGVAL
jgi:hypothetical protein